MSRLVIVIVFVFAVGVGVGVAAALCGCGTTGEQSGAGQHPPVSGAGPYRPLAPDPDYPINAPFVLLDAVADLDEPTVVADGEALALWVTATRRGERRIEHADAVRLTEGFAALEPALAADQTWEAGAVYGPSVLRLAPAQWLMFYGAGGMIGWAHASDREGHAWIKAPGPALFADGGDEGTALGPPTVVHLGDRARVYYEARGVIWGADAPFDDVAAGRATTWTRLDGDPSTPARDAFVAGAPFAGPPAGEPGGLPGGLPVRLLERPYARAALTPAGRVRHDLFFTSYTGQSDVASVIGFAASFEGVRFEVAPKPTLATTQKVRAPAQTAYGDGALLLYVQRLGARDSIAVATSP